MTRNLLLVFLGLFILLSPVTAKEEIGKNIDLGTKIWLSADSKEIPAEHYDLGASLRFYFDPKGPLDFKVETDLDLNSVSLEELWGRVKFSDGRFKFGMFENELLPDDQLNYAEYPFASDSLVHDRFSDSGWYAKRGVVGKVYTKSSKEGLGGSFTSLLTSSLSTLMFTGDIFYPLGAGQLGFTATYVPVVYKSLKVPQYNLATLYFRNLDQKADWQYMAGVSTGKNMEDPGGYTHYPDGFKNDSRFVAFDGYVSRSLKVWTPSLGGSYIMHDIDIPDSCTFDGRLGNRFSWNEMFYIHSDLGLRTHMYYAPDLTTGMELLWAVKLQFRY